MAGTIGRITTALATATVQNENSAALANLNFDFTLVKLNAPVEFNGLGATISRKRRIDAEEGALHKTARRLGALFGELLPQTDELFRAYGTRVSEISSMPSINPREGSDTDGIFANHIGADTASIWAAVTSGSAAIAVHLLGCMLARIFTGPEAISVWVELVQRQKENIRAKHGANLYSNEHSAAFSAAQQEISRTDLSNWDASARAWLQSADQAKAFNHKQAMLILNNASVPVNSEPEMYSSVLKAWVAALEAMNNLIKGLPQRVQNGAVLLAISSWHLYPDMISHGGPCVEVKQRDPMFDPTALLTLGLQHVRDDTKSVYWSLPLAFLQYYGHPVQASRTVGQENSRVTYRQFAFIILGCVFDGWGNLAATIDEGIKWIERLSLTFGISMKDKFNHGNQPTWLIYLAVAAQDFVESDDSERATAQQLVGLGRRWSSFLHSSPHHPPPLFGLSQIGILLSVLKDSHVQAQCLRQLCTYLGLNGSQLLIKYRRSALPTDVEYATVWPIPLGADTGRNIRWINLTEEQIFLVYNHRTHFKDSTWVKNRRSELQRLIPNEANAPFEAMKLPDNASTYSASSHRNDLGTINQAPAAVAGYQSDYLSPRAKEWRKELAEVDYIISIGQHCLEIESLGELLLPVLEHAEAPSQGGTLYGNKANCLMFPEALNFEDGIVDLVRKFNTLAKERSIPPPSFFLGVEDTAALCSINHVYAETIMNPFLDASFLEAFIKPDTVSFEKLASYLPKYNQLVADEISCLRACAMMAEIYQVLPGATISTLVVRQPLCRAKWIPDAINKIPLTLTRAQTFACIAMFESGTCNLDPSAVSESFAMSSGNSLYVAAALLCDPFEQPNDTEIRRVIGNIGRPGITFLISPPQVKIREADPEKWMAINHNPFNGKLEDHFQTTSIHLSFTEYEIPLVTEEKSQHLIDRGVVLVETLISVYDGGTWVAELDIVQGLMNQIGMRRGSHVADTHYELVAGKKITYQKACQINPQLAATSVENWDELIEAPRQGVIAIRAHGNWLARLAVTALCTDLQ